MAPLDVSCFHRVSVDLFDHIALHGLSKMLLAFLRVLFKNI